ncbi:MAG: flagellar biosynthesis anti-sigma factor FlgM [Desulfovibrionaceae bacterium]
MNEYGRGETQRARDEELDRAKWCRLDAEDRTDKLRRLKEQIRTGTYKADIKDIALQLAAAMEPMV